MLQSTGSAGMWLALSEAHARKWMTPPSGIGRVLTEASHHRAGLRCCVGCCSAI
jgi:hypothetical protein